MIKKTYATPMLRTHGDVEKLTQQTNGGSTTDSNYRGRVLSAGEIQNAQGIPILAS